MNVLIINGHEYYEHSKGRLNDTMFEALTDFFQPDFSVKTSILKNGFDKEEEQNKVFWADLIIYQTPIYNYSVPALFKKYIDVTHEHGVYFTGGTKEYGIGGGLLGGKRYMFSTTWNAPRQAFHNEDQFFEGKGVDDILFHLHLSHKYAGMTRVDTFSCFDVKKHPDIEQYRKDLADHLRKHVLS
ncbi:NAD(P)H-dependent oxidoreductase [Pontibacillus sp. ALD_SL1]|uniref:NAD(P)H-dependent oxidoreductase n=1 Tax=Pontibacillus sp. ALD_SL1 TaxID=2777185 RepID=UPI001A9792F8|nr:NAD(P)H-dependent oxidoreductase [Pontibacillus sp. ALD_SL1]QST01059.1 NAD(P)H-dependent oxidoreductase [Pontibacillus sp. ALD_SL1]